MNIQNIQKYHSPAESSNNSESNITPKTELRHTKKEQLVLGVSDSDASDKEDYEDPKEDDLIDDTSDKSKDRDEGAPE